MSPLCVVLLWCCSCRVVWCVVVMLFVLCVCVCNLLIFCQKEGEEAVEDEEEDARVEPPMAGRRRRGTAGGTAYRRTGTIYIYLCIYLYVYKFIYTDIYI